MNWSSWKLFQQNMPSSASGVGVYPVLCFRSDWTRGREVPLYIAEETRLILSHRRHVECNVMTVAPDDCISGCSPQMVMSPALQQRRNSYQ